MFAAETIMTMKTYIIIVLIYYNVLLSSGIEFLMGRSNESSIAILTIPCPCQISTLTCDWYHNNQSVPSQWVQANGDLMLPNWSVIGEIIGQCGSQYHSNVMTPGMCILIIYA